MIPRPAPDEDAAEDPIEADTARQRLQPIGADERRTGIIDDPEAQPTDGDFWEHGRVVKPPPTD